MRACLRVLPAVALALAAAGAHAQMTYEPPAQPSYAPAAQAPAMPSNIPIPMGDGAVQLSDAEKEQLMESFKNMTPEQRQQFQQEQEKSMTPEQRDQEKALISAFNPVANMTPQQRQQMWQGVVKGLKEKYDSSTPEEQAKMSNLTVLWNSPGGAPAANAAAPGITPPPAAGGPAAVR
jgi:hypothetical protein